MSWGPQLAMPLLTALLHLPCKPVHQTSEIVTNLSCLKLWTFYCCCCCLGFVFAFVFCFCFSFIATQSKGQNFLSFWVWIRAYCLHKDLYVRPKLSVPHIVVSVSRTETVEEYNTCVTEKKGAQVKLWRGTWVIGGVIPFPAQQGASEWQVPTSTSCIDPNNQFFPPDLVIKCRPGW